MTSSPNVSARDAALRKLTRVNHWLIAGSLTLAGVFSAVAAEAHPGQTLKTTSSTAATGKSKASGPQERFLRHAPRGRSGAELRRIEQLLGRMPPLRNRPPPTESSTPVVSGGS